MITFTEITLETIDRTNLRELSADEQKKHGLSSGIQVTGPVYTGGLCWNNNISPGFIIYYLNHALSFFSEGYSVIFFSIPC